MNKLSISNVIVFRRRVNQLTRQTSVPFSAAAALDRFSLAHGSATRRRDNSRPPGARAATTSPPDCSTAFENHS